MMFAKMSRGGMTTQLNAAVPKIIQAANARWHLLGIVTLALVMSTASPARANEAAPLQLLHAAPLPGFSGDFDHFAVDEKGAVCFLPGKITRPSKCLT